jgi:hypothetical protein
VIDNILHELVADENGSYALRDKVYRNEAFDHNFTLSNNSPYGNFALERVQFIDCDIINRSISVFGTPTLVDVSFVNTRCHTYTFCADNHLDNVRVVGGARSILWLHAPIDLKTNRDIPDVALRHPRSPDGVCLDLSDYLGQAEILHVDPRNIRINPNIHVVCERQRLETVDWENDPILSKTSFRVMLDKAEMSETGFYIGSIIGKSGKIIPTFDVALTELRRRGILD